MAFSIVYAGPDDSTCYGGGRAGTKYDGKMKLRLPLLPLPTPISRPVLSEIRGRREGEAREEEGGERWGGAADKEVGRWGRGGGGGGGSMLVDYLERVIPRAKFDYRRYAHEGFDDDGDDG